MKLTAATFPLFLAFAMVVHAVPVRRDVDPSLVPQFGHAAGVNPTGTGNCDGAVIGSNGKPVAVPCSCPPDRNSFIASLNANVNAGHATNNPSVSVSFPTDNSKGSQLSRIEAALVTLQNLHGPGVGCPAASTTFVAQQQAIQDGTPPPAVVAAPAAAPSPSPSPSPAPAQSPAATSSGSGTSSSIAALIPSLGFTAGVNPTGTGNCDGAVIGSNGKPIAVPCACPPAQSVFNAAVEANVAAGHAIHNPTVPVTFPTDNSPQSAAARIEAAIITLQNLNGPGQGCPAASTTLVAQQQAAAAGKVPPPSAVAAAPASSTSAVAPASTQAAPAQAPAAAASSSNIAALIPSLGFTAGVNPTGTGNCDGAVKGSNGKPIAIPCSCPPTQAAFNQAVEANVAAGHAIHNPGVSISFPTDSSAHSLATRIEAAIVTLQNLNGPGQGCPAASTTFSAQLTAAQAAQ